MTTMPVARLFVLAFVLVIAVTIPITLVIDWAASALARWAHSPKKKNPPAR